MAITDKQLERRRKYLGSSDVPMLLDVSPWGGPADCGADKLGLVADKPETPWLRSGRLVEHSIVRFAGEQLGKVTLRNLERVHRPGRLISHPDAWLRETGDPIEAKHVTRHNPLHDDYGEPGTDQVPHYVTVQCHVHLICSERRVCHVPVLLDGVFCMYQVARNERLCELIGEAARMFWALVDRGELPEGLPQLRTLETLQRIEGKAVEVDPQLVAAYRTARAYRLQAEHAEEGLKRMLLAGMQDGELAISPDEGLAMTYRSQKSAPRVDFEALKRDGLYRTYCTSGTHRVLREASKKDLQLYASGAIALPEPSTESQSQGESDV